jgi:hypothetical protein
MKISTTVLGVRLTGPERKLLTTVAKKYAQPGERGGASTWVRRVALEEARRLVREAKVERSPREIY